MEPPNELRNIITKLAQFVARNGHEFEEMTKQKQKDNPKFEFLFGGPFHQYYTCQVKAQQALLKIQNQVNKPLVRPPTQPQELWNDAAPPAWVGSGNPVLQPPPGPPPGLGPAMPGSACPPIAPMPPGTEWNSSPQDPIEGIKKKILDCQGQIQHSEANLAAQHAVLMQQQQRSIEEAIRESKAAKNHKWARDLELDIEEFDRKLTVIMEQCTKDAIGSGKSWILSRAVDVARARCICERVLSRCMNSGVSFDHKLHLVYLVNDLLHHCQRKDIDLIGRPLNEIAVPLFCSAMNDAPADKVCKLTKIRNLWTNNHYLDDVAQLDDPVKSMANYQAKILSENSDVLQMISADVQAKYAGFQKQHMDFVAHLTQQIQRLQADLQAAEMRTHEAAPPPQWRQPPPQQPQPAASETNGMRSYAERREGEQLLYSGSSGDYGERRDPSEYPSAGYDYNYVQPEVMPDSYVPELPYYSLPAGLIVPSVKLSDCTYEPIDPAELRLPPKMPTSDHLHAALEAFYSPPSHDRPRNAEGWEQLGLYEFYKAKNSAKAEKYKEGSVPTDGYTSAGESEDELEHLEQLQRGEKSKKLAEREARRVSRKRFRETPPPEEEMVSMSPSPPPRHESNDGSPRHSSRRQRNTSPRRRSASPEMRPSFGFSQGPAQPTRLDESNKGHQLLKKMGWGGAGLGAAEQGIAEPIRGGEVRDRNEMYRGIGMATSEDLYENYRKNRGQQFINRMRDGR